MASAPWQPWALTTSVVIHPDSRSESVITGSVVNGAFPLHTLLSHTLACLTLCGHRLNVQLESLTKIEQEQKALIEKLSNNEI